MRFGIVGLGWAARAFHLPGIKAVPGSVAIGGCDPSPEQRAALHGRRASPPTRRSTSCSSERPARRRDRRHAAGLARATSASRRSRRGVHVICEKPFVETVAQADAVLAAADGGRRQVAVNHQFREKPIFRAVMDARRRARTSAGSCSRQIGQLMDLAPWDEPVAWRAAMPNRTLFEGGVHLVDLLLDLYGELPEAVYARHSPGLDTSAPPTRSTSSRSSSPAAGSRRSRSTASARQGRATSSSAPTASTRRSAPRTAAGSSCRRG